RGRSAQGHPVPALRQAVALMPAQVYSPWPATCFPRGYALGDSDRGRDDSRGPKDVQLQQHNRSETMDIGEPVEIVEVELDEAEAPQPVEPEAVPAEVETAEEPELEPAAV